jgi:hypothetical protein
LLRELYLLRKELEILEAISDRQWYYIVKLRNVLDCNSFRIADAVRIEAFTCIERPAINHLLIDKLRPLLNCDFPELYAHIAKITEALRHTIAIDEEGSSKAILVFTLVTIVFLPLSFVVSVFGRNLPDGQHADYFLSCRDSCDAYYWRPVITGGIWTYIIPRTVEEREESASNHSWCY